MSAWRRVVVLSGGVGGARLAHGLAAALPPGTLTAIVNTGDDFVHWGLTICPDLDTVMYTLAGLSHEARGWGLADESFQALAVMERYGAPSWFQLGDRDLATHVYRTAALAQGQRLSEITAHLCRCVEITQRVVPMAEAPRRTVIDTVSHGSLPFQEWFVRERCRPDVAQIRFVGTQEPAPAALEALAAAELVVIAPSNPYVSIDPILTLAGMREAIGSTRVVAVSPIAHGKAIKGPLDRMLAQLRGKPASAEEVFAHYQDHYGSLITAVVVAPGDEPQDTQMPVLATDIIMHTTADRVRLAREVLAFAETLSR